MRNNNTKKGFTLVEILIAITILGVLLAIAVPSVSNIIKSSTREAFVLDVQKVIQRIETQQVRDANFDETNIDASNMKETLDISDSNYEALYVSSLPDETKASGKGEIYVYAVGKNKWKGLVAQGTYSSINIRNQNDCEEVEMLNMYVDIALDEDGYIVVGMEALDITDYMNGGSPVIVKRNSEGNVVWKKNLSGTGEDMFYRIITVNGGYVAVGGFSSEDGDMEGLNKGYIDAVIFKFDEFGNILWQNTFGGTSHDAFSSVIEVNDGYIAVGYTDSTDDDLLGLNKGSTDAIIVKYNTSGDVLWKNVFGGSDDDGFGDIIETDGSYIVVGSSDSNDGDLVGLNMGSTDAIIVKYNTDGEVLSENVFGGSDDDSFNAVAKTSDGYVVIGESASDDVDLTGLYKGYSDVIIVKYGSNDNVLWSRTFGGTGDEFPSRITATTDGFAITGVTNSDDVDLAGVSDSYYEGGFLLKIRADGTTEWKQIIIDTSFSALYGVVRSEKSIVTTGFSVGDTISPIINKYDLGGNVIWEKNDAPTISVCEEYDDCYLKPIYRYNIVQSDITSDSTGYVAVGSEFSDDTGVFTWFTKYDENGKILLDKEIKTGMAEPFLAYVKTLGNDYITSIYDLYFGTTAIYRFNSEGNKIWETTSSSGELYESIDVTSTTFIVLGFDENEDISFLRCFDLDGEVLWTTYLDPMNLGASVVSTNDGYLIVGSNDVDGFIIKCDTDGTIMWQKTYDIEYPPEFTSAAVSDNGYVVVGKTKEYYSRGSGIIIKYDFDGEILWEDRLDYSSFLTDVVSVSDGYIAVGNQWNTPFIIKYDEDGVKVWEEYYADFEGGFKNVVIRNDRIVALGGEEGMVDFIMGVSSPVIVSYDLNGNYKWRNEYKKDQMELICP